MQISRFFVASSVLGLVLMGAGCSSSATTTTSAKRTPPPTTTGSASSTTTSTRTSDAAAADSIDSAMNNYNADDAQPLE